MISLFDLILVAALIILSWSILNTKDLFVGIVLYMVFGLLMALAWIQLNAPNIALVEAAIGSSLIGTFFLGVLSRLEKDLPEGNIERKSKGPVNIGLPFTRQGRRRLIAFSFLLVITFVGTILTFPEQPDSLWSVVHKALPLSGVKNPVTAVILNFRAYDTLMEVAVLTLASMAVGALAKYHVKLSGLRKPHDAMLNAFIHIMIPFLILIAGYLLWTGSDRPGGAFQGGAILAGAGILMLLAGVPFRLEINQMILRIILIAGVLCFLTVGVAVINQERSFLEYPVKWSKHIILLIESISMISIAAIFVYIFAVCSQLTNQDFGNHPPRKGQDL